MHHIVFPKPISTPEKIVSETTVECFTTHGVTVLAHDLRCPDEKQVTGEIEVLLIRTGSEPTALQGTRLFYTSHTLNCDGNPWSEDYWTCSRIDTTFVFYNYDWIRMTRHGLGHLIRHNRGHENLEPCETYTDKKDNRTDYEWWYNTEFDGVTVFWIDYSPRRLTTFDKYSLGKSQRLNDLMNELNE